MSETIYLIDLRSNTSMTRYVAQTNEELLNLLRGNDFDYVRVEKVAKTSTTQRSAAALRAG